MASILVTLLSNYLFVGILRLGAFGLALSSSIGMWVFLAVQAQYYLSGQSAWKPSLSIRGLHWAEIGEILKVGGPGGVNFAFQALRGFLLNALILHYVGETGMSAFATNDSLLRFFWAIPFGMVAVSRMLFSISVGEEDRKNLTDVMRTILWHYVPLMSAVLLLVIVLADPLTRLYYRDATAPVYQLTVWGFRILPLAMPLSVFTLNYTCYVQVARKLYLTHFFSFLSGLAFVVIASALLIPWYGMIGVFAAHVINNALVALVIVLYASLYQKGRLRTLDDLMVFSPTFGVPEDEWIHLEVHDMDQVLHISEALQNFCLEQGIDRRRAFFAALAMEEMAGNIVCHGRKRNRSQYEIDIRVTRKDNCLILRIKDNCIPFDPVERLNMLKQEDRVTNIGIRMVCKIASDMQYQSILGLNALTMQI